jgi:hypothetical protein
MFVFADLADIVYEQLMIMNDQDSKVHAKQKGSHAEPEPTIPAYLVRILIIVTFQGAIILYTWVLVKRLSIFQWKYKILRHVGPAAFGFVTLVNLTSIAIEITKIDSPFTQHKDSLSDLTADKASSTVLWAALSFSYAVNFLLNLVVNIFVSVIVHRSLSSSLSTGEASDHENRPSGEKSSQAIPMVTLDSGKTLVNTEPFKKSDLGNGTLNGTSSSFSEGPFLSDTRILLTKGDKSFRNLCLLMVGSFSVTLVGLIFLLHRSSPYDSTIYKIGTIVPPVTFSMHFSFEIGFQYLLSRLVKSMRLS